MTNPEFKLEANGTTTDNGNVIVQFLRRDVNTGCGEYLFPQKIKRENLVTDIATGDLCVLVPITFKG